MELELEQSQQGSSHEVSADIIRVGKVFDDMKGGFINHFDKEARDGKTTSFWLDKWIEVEVDADNESEEKSDTEGDYTMDSDSEDLDYDPKHDDVFDDDEHIVEEVHVNMNNFRFTADPKHDTSIGGVDVQDDDLDVIDYGSFGSDLDDGINSERRMQLRKLRRIGKQKNKGPNKYYFYLRQQFASKEIVKGKVKKHSVETRRQLILVKNDNERVRVRCERTIPSLVPYVANNNNTDKIIFSQTKGGPAIRENINSGKHNILGKDKTVEGKGKKVITPKNVDKNPCPWTMLVTYTKEYKWKVRTLIKDHTCIQSRAIKACTSRFLIDHVIKSLVTNLDIPVKAVQDQMHKQFEVGVSKMKDFRVKRISSDIITGSYRKQYSLLREYAQELINQNSGITVRINVQQEPNPESLTSTFRRVSNTNSSWVDANNRIYPVAYAIVEAEIKASWCWFLNLLREDLGIESNFSYTFISDRQKGLIQAIVSMFLSAKHKYCVRHIHENMKSRFKGGVYKEMLWNAAKATSESEFKKKIGEVKSFNSDAYDWLMKIPLEQWSRAYFLGRAKCDLLINNIFEVFNRQLVDGRDQPIITCLEYIREYLMKRIMATEYNVEWDGGFLYQVAGPYKDQYVVNMDRRVCSYRKWELTQIPCKHVVAAIYNMSENSVGVVVESSTSIIPPSYKPLIGRPPKKRKKSNDEIASQSASSGKLSRKGKSVSYGKYGNMGRNRNDCRGQGGGSSQVGARKVSGQAAGATNVYGQAAGARKVSGQVVGETNVYGQAAGARKVSDQAVDSRKVSGQAADARKASSQPSIAQSTTKQGPRQGFQGPITGLASGSQRKTKKLMNL
nr:hypothetical protein [Tanacetum cinerariifolium]